MVRDEEGFFYPKVEESGCIGCGLCTKVCPVLNAKPDDAQKRPDAWAAINRDEAVREESSSGGVFTLLAERVLDRGGVVFGAAWEQDFRTVRHIPVRTQEELRLLRGSKFLQSEIGDCYQQAKQRLDAGEAVLFSGTPCQIEGLRAYLGKAYKNLLCVDIVCHGVPSPNVWQKFLAECDAGRQISNVKFRNKVPGWKEYSVKIQFRNGKQQTTPFDENPYMRAFLSNACLRPSCYDCRFKKGCRESDLTLADFWGIEEVCPGMDDDRGTSLVLVHSPAGMAALEAVSSQLRLEAVAFDAALKHNPSALFSSRVHENREAFLRSLNSMSFAEAVNRWLPRKRSWKEKTYDILRRAGMAETVKKILGKK